jgi:hypothetical protein
MSSPSNQSRNPDSPTYLLDSSTLIGLQLKEPFYPRDLSLPQFYQRPLEQDPINDETDPDKNHDRTRYKIDPGVIRALIGKITIEEELDSTELCLGMARFQLRRHLLNPSLTPEPLLATDTQPQPLPNWVERVRTTLYRFTAILAERNQAPPAQTPLAQLLEERQHGLQLAKELAHHVQAASDKRLFTDIYTGANLYQEKEINAWLQPNDQQKAERELIFEQEQQAQRILQEIGPEEIETEAAQQALSQIENARRYRDREKPHRLVWEPYHLLTLLRPNVYVISTNPVCDAIVQVIKNKNVQVERYGIQTSHLDNLTEISSQKYMLKPLVPMKPKTLEKKLERPTPFSQPV